KYVVYIKPKNESHFLTEFELIDKKYDVEIFTAPTGWDINLGAKSGTKPIVLGEGQYYLLGDNRMECIDSRLWGPVKKNAIKGRVVLQYFPFNKIKVF
ncbi:MAG: signal peptidase I, partial [Treponema sp.]|nr:signal peptidase I [Treponema sp.]